MCGVGDLCFIFTIVSSMQPSLTMKRHKCRSQCPRRLDVFTSTWPFRHQRPTSVCGECMYCSWMILLVILWKKAQSEVPVLFLKMIYQPILEWFCSIALKGSDSEHDPCLLNCTRYWKMWTHFTHSPSMDRTE